MSTNKPTYRDLEKRLAALEPIMEALRRNEVDAIVGEDKIAFLLLRGVEEALVASEAGFRAMFELPGIGMVQADLPALRFTKVNKKICEMTGYSEEELLTKTYIGLTHPLDRMRDMNAVGPVIRGKDDSWFIEKRCVRKDGSVVRVGVHGAILRDGAGHAVRVMAMVSELAASKSKRVKKATVKKARKSSGAKASDKVRKERR